MTREREEWDEHAAHQIRFHNYVVDGHAVIGVSCVCFTRLAKGTHRAARALGYPDSTEEGLALYKAHVQAAQGGTSR